MSEVDEMLVRGAVPYYGSKRLDAPAIVEEMGPHSARGELCCGSMAVTLAAKPVPMEFVNDLHGDVINLAWVLASDSCDILYEKVSKTLMCEGVFQECKAIIETKCDVAASVKDVCYHNICRAWAFMVASWQGINGVTGTGRGNIAMAKRFTAGGGHGGRRWISVAQSIPAWHERLRNVTIYQMCMFDLLESMDDAPEWVLYLDPPYVTKGDKYVHDFPTIAEERESRLNPDRSKWLKGHIGLAERCARFKKSRVIVSYYDCPEVRELYDGWTFVDRSRAKAMVNSGMRDGKMKSVVAPEVLIINGPSYTESSLFT